MIAATVSVFNISKDLLYGPNGSIVIRFKEMKTNSKFILKMTIYFFLSMIIFLLYGYSVYLLFYYKQGIISIIYFGFFVSIFLIYITHLTNLFVFNSYFSFTNFNYSFKACFLIITKRKFMTFLMTINFLVWALATYFEPIIIIIFSVGFGIYSMQYFALKSYEQLKREEDERLKM